MSSKVKVYEPTEQMDVCVRSDEVARVSDQVGFGAGPAIQATAI